MLNYHQRQRDFGPHELPALNDELFVFPHGMSEDLVDAVTAGINALLKLTQKASKPEEASLD